MNLENRKEAFIKLGTLLRELGKNSFEFDWLNANIKEATENLQLQIKEAHLYNGWFTRVMVEKMIASIGESLSEKRMNKWLKPYLGKLGSNKSAKTIAVVMAGNIPLVGFHDLLCVLISGNKLLAKLSSDDNKLLPALADLLIAINPGFRDLLKFTDGKVEKFDAVIATGSNNTSRYFDFYFGKYPNIIRKNRNGVAVLSGNESADELMGLTEDVFLYYGLGCRNVSKLYLPKDYDLTSLLKVFETRKSIAENHKYFNNYEYNKAIYLVNGTKHYDSGNLILTENESIASPVSVVYFGFYDNLDNLKTQLYSIADQIQCVVSNSKLDKNEVDFGKSQQPQLWDYADGIDTMEFLLSLD
jgi:hypothetical protein